jgi:hypothetical protein
MENINRITDAGNGLTLESTVSSIEIDAVAPGNSIFLIADFIDVYGGGAAASTMRFYEDSGSNFVGLKAPASISTDFSLTLPPNDGASGQLLKTDGSGIMTWSSEAFLGININQQSSWGADVAGLVFDGAATDIASTDTAGIYLNGDSTQYLLMMTTDKVTGGTAGIYQITGNTTTSGSTGGWGATSGAALGASGDSGPMDITSGNSIGGNSGPINIGSGVASASLSGDVNIFTGSATTQGRVIVNARTFRVPKSAAVPTATESGEMYYNTGTNKSYTWDGSNWQAHF